MLLRDFIPRCAASFPEDPAYIWENTRRTWREIDLRTNALGGALQSMGLSKGDAVAILSGNRTEIAEHWLMCLKTGMVRTGLNPRYSAKDLLHAVRDSRAKALLVCADSLESLRPEVDQLARDGLPVIGFGEGHGQPHDYEALVAAGHALRHTELREDDLALIGYTSGSTGLPKGVMLTQKNVMASCFYQAFGPGFTKDDVRLYCSNTAGINIFTACSNILNGMTNVFADFHADHVLDLIQKHRVTHASLVPTMLRRLVEKVRTGAWDVTSLKQIIYGSMPATPTLIKEAHEVLGCELIQIYGSSECGGPMTLLSSGDHRRALTEEPGLLLSAGRAYPHVDLSIRDDDGQPVPTGEIGTVWVGGDVVMAGYLNLPEDTAEALPSPGWLRTGDIGRVDHRGYLFLSDRRKNLIISGGMNIHPLGVENALALHPAVREAAVVGVKHPEWGEAVVAVVALKGGAGATPAELIEHCRTLVPTWEVPKHIEIIESMPMGFTGKIDKPAIRQMLKERVRLPWDSAGDRTTHRP